MYIYIIHVDYPDLINNTATDDPTVIVRNPADSLPQVGLYIGVSVVTFLLLILVSITLLIVIIIIKKSGR